MTSIQGVVSQEGSARKMAPGVLVEGPVVDAKDVDWIARIVWASQ